MWFAPGILFVSSYLDEFYLLAQAVCSKECCLKALYLLSVLDNKEPSLDQIGSLTHNSNAITFYKIPSRHHKKCRSEWLMMQVIGGWYGRYVVLDADDTGSMESRHWPREATLNNLELRE